MVKNPPVNAKDRGLNSRSRRSPGEGNGNPVQYACLENPMDRGSSCTIVHGVAQSWTQLSNWHFDFLTLSVEWELLELPGSGTVRPGVAPGGSHTAMAILAGGLAAQRASPRLHRLGWRVCLSTHHTQPQGWRSAEVIKVAEGKSTIITLALRAQLLVLLDFWSRDTKVSFSKKDCYHIYWGAEDRHLAFSQLGLRVLCLIANLYVSPCSILAASVPFIRLQEQSAPNRVALKSSSVVSHSSEGLEFTIRVLWAESCSFRRLKERFVAASLQPLPFSLHDCLPSVPVSSRGILFSLFVCIQIFFFLMKIVILLD